MVKQSDVYILTSPQAAGGSWAGVKAGFDGKEDFLLHHVGDQVCVCSNS